MQAMEDDNDSSDQDSKEQVAAILEDAVQAKKTLKSFESTYTRRIKAFEFPKYQPPKKKAQAEEDGEKEAQDDQVAQAHLLTSKASELLSAAEGLQRRHRSARTEDQKVQVLQKVKKLNKTVAKFELVAIAFRDKVQGAAEQTEERDRLFQEAKERLEDLNPGSRDSQLRVAFETLYARDVSPIIDDLLGLEQDYSDEPRIVARAKTLNREITERSLGLMKNLKTLWSDKHEEFLKRMALAGVGGTVSQVETDVTEDIDRAQGILNEIEVALDEEVGELAKAAESLGGVPLITQRPIVKIFEQTPQDYKVVINGDTGPQDVRALQEQVKAVLGARYTWPPIGEPTRPDCPGAPTGNRFLQNQDTWVPPHLRDGAALDVKVDPRTAAAIKKAGKADLSAAQQIVINYMTPFNRKKNIIVVHSAGSGKSCTLALVGSLFARAGYSILLSSKSAAISDEIPDSQIYNGCDVNLQQFTQGRPLREAIRQEFAKQGKPPPENFTKAAQTILKDMGTSQYWSFFSYLALANMASPDFLDPTRDFDTTKLGIYLNDPKASWVPPPDAAKGGLNKPTMAFLFGTPRLDELDMEEIKTPQQRVQKERRDVVRETGDFLYKCFINIDEIHKLLFRQPDIKGWKVNFANIRAMIWRSYEAGKKHGHPVRLVGATATPVPSHAVDGVNLATLLHPEEVVRELGLADYADTYPEVKKTAAQKKFHEDHVDPKTQLLKPSSRKRIMALFNGSFSYLNFTGAVSKFARPKYIYHDVQLSELQTKSILAALALPRKMTEGAAEAILSKADTLFSYDADELRLVKPLTGQFASAYVKGVVKKALQSEGKKGTVNVDDPEIQALLEAGPEDLKAQIELLGIRRGIMAYSYWPMVGPTQTKLTKAGKISTSVGRGMLAESILKDPIKFFAKRSGTGKPVLNMSLVKKMSPMMAMALERITTIVHESTRSSRLVPGAAAPAVKIFVYVDVGGSHRQNHYGIRMLQTLLEFKGFIDVSGGTTPKPYHGIIQVGHSNRSHAQALAAQFNAPANSNGKLASIFLADSSVREGLNLKKVTNVQILGAIPTRADLIQAVARAFRLCSSANDAFVPGKGWEIPVEIYSPYLAGTRHLHPIELARAFDPTMEGLEEGLDEISGLVKECAFDKLLLENINRASEEVLKGLRLWEPSEDDALAKAVRREFHGGDVTQRMGQVAPQGRIVADLGVSGQAFNREAALARGKKARGIKARREARKKRKGLFDVLRGLNFLG